MGYKLVGIIMCDYFFGYKEEKKREAGKFYNELKVLER